MPGQYKRKKHTMKDKRLLISMLFFLCMGSMMGQQEKTIENQVELAYKIESELGEGAFWDHKNKRLFWVDIEGMKVHVYDPKTKKNVSFDTPSMVGTVVVKDKDEAIIALVDGIYLLNTKSGSIKLFSDIESEITSNRFNDGKCDPNGNLWVGSMSFKQTKGEANLYKLAPNGKSEKMLDSVTISNGIVWTGDQKTMYYIDTPTMQIRAFDFDANNSTISNGRIAVIVPEALGFPDGMTIDAEDKLWVGLWNGNAVARFDPISGSLITKIEVPAHNVTSCSFGGENLETLFITTASLDMTEEEQKKYPLAGSLFQVNPGVKGVEGNYFGK